jgi:catechol 2,3-dioxygenase-like lactoylglutathione lyase family enzyme
MAAWRFNGWTTSASWWNRSMPLSHFSPSWASNSKGRAMIEGDWSGRVTGLRDQRVEVAMMRTPDGHGRIELSRFLAPPVVADHRNAPVNALGYLRVMFAVDDLDDTLARLRRRGAQLVDEVVQYEDVYRLCYVRGPEGILIGLAEQIG